MPKKTDSTAPQETAAPREIRELVEKFAEHRETYRRAGYNETQLRQDFLDPFFIALGWDIYNRGGIHENYRDVILEHALRVEKSVKAPDYCIRIGPIPKFFVEAKKPAVDIKGDIGPAFQLRRYAWTAKLPLSILTDFEEFAVYDCRIKPDKDDSAATARVMLLSYMDYIDRWGDIAGIFSREAVLKGCFDDFAGSTKKKRGTAEVDQAFLEEIEAWREALAKNLSLRNETITDRELNAAVQLIIDRIIFLRMCEGRDIEPYGGLQSLLNGERVYPRLVEMFHRADEKYNSGLFHFQKEKDREPPDELTTGLVVDDKILKDIIRRLYYPESPYEFAALPADILGQVYEQFLGKVIRLTAGHRAKIEEKPEVRKAGGVYYTPTYIVEYIVENTVGKLVEGKTPQEVGGLTATYKPAKNARPLAVLDPACGSGSFLIVAYQYLLDWYLKHYIEHDPKKHAGGANPRIYRTTTGDWRLTIAERKRILLSHIYGVDIDSQAVEVTKLSLLLKVLEGETEATLRQLEAFHKERALPDLANNIKCGNSLIGPDFYDGKQRELFDESEMLRINAFDWKGKHGFPHVFASDNPGFDAVIGNPPYGAAFSDAEKRYLFAKYPAIVGQPESYEYFLFMGTLLSAASGYLAFISPTNFIESDRAEGLRRRLLDSGSIQSIDNFRYNVWSVNAAEPLVMIYQKLASRRKTIVSHPDSKQDFIARVGRQSVDSSLWKSMPKTRFLIRAQPAIIRKIEANKLRLGDCYDVSQGIIVYKTREQSEKNPYIDDKPHGPEWRRLLDTKSTVRRYQIEWGGRYLKYGEWLWCPRDAKYFDQPKLVFVRLRNKSLSRKLVAAFDDTGYVNRDNFNNIIAKDAAYSLFFLLGIFNSKMVNYWYKAMFDNVNINPAQVRLIPLPRVQGFNGNDERIARAIESAAEQITEMYGRLAAHQTAHHRAVLERQIEHTDTEIDRLVYELYGLTEDEIAIVEEATGR